MELPRAVVVVVVVLLLLLVVEFASCVASCPGSVDDEVPAAVKQEAGPPPVGCVAPRRPDALLVHALRLQSAGGKELDVVRREADAVTLAMAPTSEDTSAKAPMTGASTLGPYEFTPLVMPPSTSSGMPGVYLLQGAWIPFFFGKYLLFRRRASPAALDQPLSTHALLMGKGRTKGAKGAGTPKKAQISRDHQTAEGPQTHRAAAAMARKHGLGPTNDPSQVKKWNAEIRDGVASRTKRRSSGRPKGLTPEVKHYIAGIFDEYDTRTNREAGEKLGLPASTLHDYAAQGPDCRCLNQTVRPRPILASLDRRMAISRVIVNTPAPYKTEFYQDEKYCVVNAGRRQRKVKNSDGSTGRRPRYAC